MNTTTHTRHACALHGTARDRGSVVQEANFNAELSTHALLNLAIAVMQRNTFLFLIISYVLCKQEDNALEA